MKLGFTVGVWDLFHQGHINFLKKCHEYCDYLFVGIMTDYWVTVQKGKNRPIESLAHRISNLQNSHLSDKIVILDTLDMEIYLSMVDIWIKGEGQCNMRPINFPNIIYIERTKGISTTLLARTEH